MGWSRKTKNWVHLSAGALLSIVLIWLAFRGTDWHEVGQSILQANPWWLVANQVGVWAGFWLRVQRWRYIVHAQGPASFRNMFSATQIGFLANVVVPLRVGELIRAYLIARFERLTISKGVALVALDRVTDFVGLLIVLVVTVVAFPAAQGVVIPAELLGTDESFRLPPGLLQTGTGGALAAFVVMVGALVLLYTNQALAFRINEALVGRISQGLARRTRGMFESFAEGLHIFRSATDMLKSCLYSIALWGSFLFCIVTILEACHIEYDWYTCFIIQSLLAVAVAVPVAPGLVGQFHLAIVVGLYVSLPAAASAPGARELFTAAAILMHLGQLIPVSMAGVYCLVQERVGLFELSRRSQAAEAALEQAPPPSP